MTTVTSAPIGSTGMSLEGVAVDTAAGTGLFRESVVQTDPTDPEAYTAVVSTTPAASAYGGVVRVAGTPSVSVAALPTVSAQIISSIPFYVAQSSAPWSVNGAVAVSNTVNVSSVGGLNVVSSIPFYVTQSSAPWQVNGTTNIQGTSSVNVLGSIPGTTMVNIVSTVPQTIQGTSSVNVLGSIPGTTMVNVVSSVTFDGLYDASTNATPPTQMAFIGGRAATTNPTAIGNGSTIPMMFDTRGRAVITYGQVRERVNTANIVIASSSAETTLIPATANEFHDLCNLYLSNNSSAAGTVTLRDATAVSTVAVIFINSTYASQVNVTFNPPLPQTSTNSNWTIQLSTSSLMHVRAMASFIRN